MKYMPKFASIIGVFALLSPAAAPVNWQGVGQWMLDFGRDLLFFLVLGLLAIWLFPNVLKRCAQVLRRSPVKSFFTGIAVLFAGYASILILFLLVIVIGIFFYVITFGDAGGLIFGLGLPAVGLVFGALNLTVAYLTKLVVAFLIGLLLLETLLPKALKHNIWPLLAGVVVYLLIRAIPWLGWAIGVAATLAGLGAIWLGWRAPRKLPEAVATVEDQPVAATLDQPAEEVQPEEAQADEAAPPAELIAETSETVIESHPLEQEETYDISESTSGSNETDQPSGD
jgi:hypothetical protein